MDATRVGAFLAAMRKAQGYTQQAVAERLSLSNKTVSKWESGGGLPDVAVLPALAELYGVTVDEILAGKRIEGAPSATEQGRCREAGVYLLRRGGLAMDLCCLFAAAILLWQAAEEILACVRSMQGIGYGGTQILAYLEVAAGIALGAGALIERYFLSAAKSVADEEIWRTQRRRAAEKVLYPLTVLLPVLSRWAMLRYEGQWILVGALTAAWVLLLRKHPSLAGKGSRILLLLAAAAYCVGYAACLLLAQRHVTWAETANWLYGLCIPVGDLLVLAAALVQTAGRKR